MKMVVYFKGQYLTKEPFDDFAAAMRYIIQRENNARLTVMEMLSRGYDLQPWK